MDVMGSASSICSSADFGRTHSGCAMPPRMLDEAKATARAEKARRACAHEDDKHFPSAQADAMEVLCDAQVQSTDLED